MRIIRLGAVGLALLVAIVALASIPGPEGDAAFPGANGDMVYSRKSGSSRVQLFTRDANGGFATELTFPVNADDFNPSASPDGSKVAFERVVNGQPHLRIVNADGTGDVAVAGGEGGRRPAWSPDGTQLVFERGGDLFKMNLDGSGLANLTESLDSAAAEADWSPDGQHIAFKVVEGPREPIYVMDADGANAAPLEALTGTLEDGYPDWSPDGSKIVYDQFDASTGEIDIFVVNINGTGRVNLTADIEEDARHPAWSPDGTMILFERGFANSRSGVGAAGIPPTNLWTMNADGTGKNDITEDALVLEIDPDWAVAFGTPTPTPEPGQNVIWGDNRCDGELDSTDGLAVLRNVAALSALSQTQPCPLIGQSIRVLQPGRWGDVDCDQDIDSVDALKVLRTIAGFSVDQPVNCYPIGLEDAVIFY